MTTKEFIKKLKKEDPSGKAHVRAGGGAILYFELKPGYYDGAYQYIDKDGNLVISNQGQKVDVVSIDYEGWIWEHDGDYSKIKFDLGALVYSEKEIESYKERFKEISEKYKRFEQQSLEQFTFYIMQKYKEGFIAAQPKTEKIGMYNVMYFYKDGKKDQHLRQGDCGAILESGFFKPITVEKDELIWWELDL